MPVVDVDTDELRSLIGKEVSDEQLKEDLFALGLEFEGETEDGELQFEFAPDRLDRLSVEGVARSLQYQYGEARGVALPSANDPDWVIEVEESVPDERPYVTGAVIRGVELDDAALQSLIQLQEKLHATMGRDRAKGAIGVHDLTMLQGASLSGGGGLTEVTSEEGDPEADDPIEYTPAGEERIAEEGTVRRGQQSITYRGIAPDGDRFVPLDYESMSDAGTGATPAEVLEQHPTGDTYGDIVAGYDRLPAIYDERGLFSFPPVINGQRTEVSTDSRDLLIELTGTDQWTIDRMCVILCYALAARGGQIEAVRVEYADGATAPDEGRELRRPDLTTDEKRVSHARIERTLGIELEPETIVDLFERSGLDATYTLGEAIEYEVAIPPYRVDVLHPADLVDDVGRAYGFNTLEPEYPDLGTIGGRRDSSRLEDAVRETLIGLGFQDTLNFNMTAPSAAYDRMRLDRPADTTAEDRVVPDDGPLGAQPAVEITSPYSEEYTQLRTWALPSLLQVLANNTHRRYPQDLAEVGFVAHRDDREPTNVAEARHVAGVLARTDASYEDAKGRLQALCTALGVDLATPPTEHPSFIPGRVATVRIDGSETGVIGELHPEVLVAHDLDVPVVGFEIPLDAFAD